MDSRIQSGINSWAVLKTEREKIAVAATLETISFGLLGTAPSESEARLKIKIVFAFSRAYTALVMKRISYGFDRTELFRSFATRTRRENHSV